METVAGVGEALPRVHAGGGVRRRSLLSLTRELRRSLSHAIARGAPTVLDYGVGGGVGLPKREGGSRGDMSTQQGARVDCSVWRAMPCPIARVTMLSR